MAIANANRRGGRTRSGRPVAGPPVVVPGWFIWATTFEELIAFRKRERVQVPVPCDRVHRATGDDGIGEVIEAVEFAPE